MSRVRIRVRDRLGIKGIKGEKHKNNTKQHKTNIKTRVRVWVGLGGKKV